MTKKKGLKLDRFLYAEEQKYCVIFERGWEEISYGKNAVEAEKKVHHLQGDYGRIVSSINLTKRI